ncbi:glycogen synthase [Patescibacteria group bacterium]|nr:glycogen synthase [Patescibacteria group bacterium]
MSQVTKVLFAAAELTPLAKVGGLADVVGALPVALSKQGIDARVIMPKYQAIDADKYPLKPADIEATVLVKGKKVTAKLWETTIPKSRVPVYLIANDEFFSGDKIYFDNTDDLNKFDELERFLFFAKAVSEIINKLGWSPQILHCHDWQASLIPLLLKIKKGVSPGSADPATILTIHNLSMQGQWKTRDIFDFLNIALDSHASLTELSPEDNYNILAQGISDVDIVNTVSPEYAKEILTPELGLGLEKILSQHKQTLFGITNGLDTSRFNPASDPKIEAPYSADSLAGKQINKLALQKKCHLNEEAKKPIFGFVGRLTDQKGMGLIGANVDTIIEQGGQLVILGTGMSELEEIARLAAKKYPGKVHATIDFDAAFAQQIYAGSDFFLMPSKFEPCGLGQLIAMSYGTIPIVRATGGLKDTVPDYNLDKQTGRGFSFEEYKPEALGQTIKLALLLYKNPQEMTELIQRIMRLDLSWDKSSTEYINLYNKAKHLKGE